MIKTIYETKFRDNTGKIPSAEEVTPEFKDTLEKLFDYRVQYENGENITIHSDNLFFKGFVESGCETVGHQDTIDLESLMNLESLNKVTKIKENSEYLVGLRIEIT